MDEAESLFAAFHNLILDPTAPEPDLDTWGELAVLAGVCRYPNRIKCANLAWHAMRAALHDEAHATTE